MKLTKRQQKLAAVAGLGCLSVLIDRVLVAPSSAVADSPAPAPTTTVAVPTPTDATATESDAPPIKTLLAERFQEIAAERALDPTQVTDAFQVPPAWLPNDPGAVQPVAVDDPGVAALVSKFKSAHRLNAVMANGNAGYAIVDGKRLRMGQKLDGLILVEVRRRSIVLEGQGARVELALPARLKRSDG